MLVYVLAYIRYPSSRKTTETIRALRRQPRAAAQRREWLVLALLAASLVSPLAALALLNLIP